MIKISKHHFYFNLGATVDVYADQAKMRGHTPLFCAAEKGHLYIVKMLITEGADVNFKDCTNVTALHGAANNGHEEVCKYLIEKDANLEAKDLENRTPLHHAVAGDCARENDYMAAKTVECLLNRGAKVNVESDLECTPLDCANVIAQLIKNQEETKVQKMLKKHGAISGKRNDMSKQFFQQCKM